MYQAGRPARPVLFIGFLLLQLACQPALPAGIEYGPVELAFSGERALATETLFVTQFPHRHSGMPNNLAAINWLDGQLQQLGLDCRRDDWQVINFGQELRLNNLICTLPGQSPRQILIVAHHDQSPATIQGADNDGSGIAILLQLAQIFAAEPEPAHTLTFLISDGEEYGMLGSRRYIQTHPDTGSIIAGISLDNLGKVHSDGIDMEVNGQLKGVAPLWLQRVAQEAAHVNKDIWIPQIRSFPIILLSQAVPVSFMDQGPLVTAGVPAIGFATTHPPEHDQFFWETYHTPLDTVDHQSAGVLHQAGSVAEALIRQLLSMREFPSEHGPYLYFAGRDRVLRGWPLWGLLGAFVSFFFVACYAAGGRLSQDMTGALRSALPHFLSLWLPLVGSILLLYSLVATGLILSFEAYPALAKDPYIFSPRWPAVLTYLAGLGLLLAGGRYIFRSRPSAPRRATFAQRKSLAFFVVGLAALYILFRNPFSLIFLAPVPAWAFIHGRKGVGRLLDILLFLVGGLVIYAMLYFFGFVILRNNLAVLWYVMNMIAIGMVSFWSTAVSASVIAAGLTLITSPPRRHDVPGL